jgi:hypothetical protein
MYLAKVGTITLSTLGILVIVNGSWLNCNRDGVLVDRGMAAGRGCSDSPAGAFKFMGGSRMVGSLRLFPTHPHGENSTNTTRPMRLRASVNNSGSQAHPIAPKHSPNSKIEPIMAWKLLINRNNEDAMNKQARRARIESFQNLAGVFIWYLPSQRGSHKFKYMKVNRFSRRKPIPARAQYLKLEFQDGNFP